MRFRFFFIFAPLFALFSMQGCTQTAAHPGAEKAMERIVLERDFGDNLKFHSRKVITIAENPKVPGLNGLMFMRSKGAAPAMEVVASVQWFEDTGDLLHFLPC